MENPDQKELGEYTVGETLFNSSAGPIKLGSVNMENRIVGLHVPLKRDDNWATYPHAEMEKFALEFAKTQGCTVCYFREANIGWFSVIEADGTIGKYDWLPDDDPRFTGVSAISPQSKPESTE